MIRPKIFSTFSYNPLEFNTQILLMNEISCCSTGNLVVALISTYLDTMLDSDPPDLCVFLAFYQF